MQGLDKWLLLQRLFLFVSFLKPKVYSGSRRLKSPTEKSHDEATDGREANGRGGATNTHGLHWRNASRVESRVAGELRAR
jgi:hypothetical protein